MIMKKNDKSQCSAPFFDRGKGVHKENLKKLRDFLIILVMLILTTVINVFLEHIIQPSSLVFVYLVPTIAGAIYFGTWAAVLSFTAGFFIFNFGFVEPYYSLHISNPQDIYNVTVYFSIAALITYLINIVRRQYTFLKSRLDRVSLIEEMSSDFLLLTPIEESSLTQNITKTLRTRVFSQLGQLALKYVKTILDTPALVFFREDDGSLKVWAKSSADLEITEKENDAATWTFKNGEVSGAGTLTYADTPFYFIPMKSLEGIIGVLGILCDSKDLFPEQRRLLGTIANLTTIIAAGWMRLKPKGN
jgi:two-component system, OmpR family, sensor histidine kinase KdpD